MTSQEEILTKIPPVGDAVSSLWAVMSPALSLTGDAAALCNRDRVDVWWRSGPRFIQHARNVPLHHLYTLTERQTNKQTAPNSTLQHVFAI